MTATKPRAPATEPLVAQLAAQLGETEATPPRQIARTVATLGEERMPPSWPRR